jgi:predicted dehydrogenase
VSTKVAIIGLGKMGVMHAANLSLIPEAQIVAVVDTQAQLANQVRSLGLDAPFFRSAEEMVERIAVDAAFVCTPAAAHLSTAQICVRRGIHVFVEKPLANTLEQARAMVDLVEGSAIVHAVGYMKGHSPLYEKMRAVVRGGTLGRVRQSHCSLYLSQVFRPPQGWTYRKDVAGGGIVINSTCHLLFLLQSFLGDVSGVFARARSIHSEVEDAATIVLEFADGAVASINTSWSVPGHSVEHTHILMIGDRGTLEVTDDRARLFLTESDGQYAQGWTAFHRAEFDRAPVDLSAEYGGEGYFNEDADFIRCCASGGTPRVSWREGLAVQRIIDAIYRSAAAGYVAL